MLGTLFAINKTEPFFLYFNPTVPHGSNSVRDALTKFTCRDVANGTLDSDPMIEGMTLEYGNCADYRDSIFNRTTKDNELGPIWVDDSIGALFKALENTNRLNNTVRVETMYSLYDIYRFHLFDSH